MKTKCPNIHSEDWKKLVSSVGERLAWKTVVAYDGLPDTDMVNKIIANYPGNRLGIKVKKVKQAIVKALPVEISETVEVVDKVPGSVLGNRGIFFSIKEILEDNGITDPLLMNWAGIHIRLFGNPKGIKSAKQIETAIEKRYKEKVKTQSPVFKSNPQTKQNFDNWVRALEGYPLPFKDLMLSHAIKNLINPDRTNKFILQLSEVTLANTYRDISNQPHKLNQVGKVYNSNLLQAVSDAVGHEPSASGKGYWVHVPKTPSGKIHGFNSYEELKNEVETLNNTIKRTEELKTKPAIFKSQEPHLTREDADKYGFKEFEYVRVESTYSRWGKLITLGDRRPHVKELGENYEGYYIHGYNTRTGKPSTKIVKISKSEAEQIWRKEIERDPMAKYEVGDAQEILRLNDVINRWTDLTNKLKSSKPSDWGTTAVQHKANVELLKKLSPHTWCTASTHASYYVENYDNYLLVVNGRTVVGIEAGDNGKVKEVTSIANNGIASVDHLDDTLAFFEKHNLDTNNSSLKNAIKAREKGKTDVDISKDNYYGDEEEGVWYPDMDWENQGPEFDPDDQMDPYNELVAEASTLTTVEEALAFIPNLGLGSSSILEHIPQNLKDDERVARAIVEKDPYSIVFINHNIPNYLEIAHMAMQKTEGGAFEYISQEAKAERRNIDLHDVWIAGAEAIAAADDLPFSKINSKVQGYYDSNSDRTVIVAENTSVKDAPKVAIHEIAHRGMLRMAKDLGGTDELFRILMAAKKELFRKLPELLRRTGHKDFNDLMIDYGFEKDSKEGQLKILMELAARWSETLVGKPKPTWWRQLIGSISNWLKRFTGIRLSEYEVDELVGGFVQYGSQNESGQFVKPRETKTTLIERLRSKGLVDQRFFTYKGNKEYRMIHTDPKKDFIKEQGRVYIGENNKKAIEDINKVEFGGLPVIELVPTGRVTLVRINEALLNTVEANKRDNKLFQLQGGESTKPVDPELRAKLLKFADKYGIKVETIDNMLERTGYDAAAVADMINKVILIASGKETSETLSEEIGHFAFDMLIGHPYYNRIMSIIEQSVKYEQVRKEYSHIYGDDVNRYKREAAGQLLSDAIHNKWSEPESSNPILRTIQAIWGYLKRFWNRYVLKDVQAELNDITGLIARDILTESYENFNERNIGQQRANQNNSVLFSAKKTYLDELKESLAEAMEIINKKLKIYRETDDKRFVNRESALFEKLKVNFAMNETKEGLVTFIEAVRYDLGSVDLPDTVMGRLSSFHERVGKEDGNKLTGELRSMLKFSNSFLPVIAAVKNTLMSLKSTEKDPDLTKLLEEVKDLESDINWSNDRVKAHMYKVTGTTFKEWGGEFTYDSKGNKIPIDWEEALKNAPKDISFVERWFDALADAKDPILQIFDKITKALKREARQESEEALVKIIQAHKELEASGHTTDAFIEKDKDGNVTGNWVTKYNIGQYYINFKTFAQEMKTKYKLGKDQYRPEDPTDLKNWKSEWGKWYEENTDWVDDAEDIKKDKEAQFKKEYGETLGQSIYENWLENNTSTTYDRYGNKYIKPRGELQRPSNKYLNKQYEKILKTDALKKYYSLVYENPETKEAGYHMKAVKKLPHKAQTYMWHTLPQVMKEYLERAKDKGASVGGQWGELKTTMANSFIRHEGDVEFGGKFILTDENQNPTNFLPIHYITAIKDKKNLSLDISAGVAKFYDSAANYWHMSKMIHILEVGKDLMKDRRYDRRDAFGRLLLDPVTYFKDKKRKLTADTREAAYALERLEDYAKMNWYGKLKMDEGQLFGTGLDQAKVIDAFGRYVSLNNLALNLYSGISNITYGKSVIFEEAIAGEYFKGTDLGWAEMEYQKQMLTGGFLEVGQRLKTNKLHLFNRFMDTFEDHNQRMRQLNLHNRTLIGSALESDFAYFMNNTGEHWLQSTLSLALANTIRFNSSGDHVWMADFTGSKEEWEKMPTIYDALEVKGDKLVPKDGFKVDKALNVFKERLSFINHSLNGIYNEIDRPAIQKHSLGRALLMFRKYMRPALNRRFRTGAYYHGPELYREGFHTTMLNYTLFNWIKGAVASLRGKEYEMMRWKDLNAHQVANIKRSVAEIAWSIALAFLSYAIKNLSDDDDENWVLDMTAYQINRLYTEITAWTPQPAFVSEATKLLKSPAAGITVIDNLMEMFDIFSFFEWTEEGLELEVIKSGYNKGETRLGVTATKNIPFWRTIDRVAHPEELLQYYTK